VQEQKEHKKLGREKLQRIIEMCIAIENHQVNPFQLGVTDIIKMVQEYFPHWEKAEEFNLDAEAIHHLASVIKLQSEWVKNRSTSLYTDPFLLEEKIRRTSKEEMTQIFLKAYHPLVELEQLSINSLAEAIRYWNTLLPMEERWKEIGVGDEAGIGSATREEMVKQRILGDKLFSDELEAFWKELKKKTEEKDREGKLRYWDFIGAATFEETIQRAFMTSFLVTYGYATLEIHPLMEENFIKPFDKPQARIGHEQLISIPLSVTVEDWKKWKRGELD
jgi:hypothetical protein